MADLSPYVNFSVTLDKSGTIPTMKIRDTGAYPSGVPQIVTGFVSILQPDGIELATSNTADITFGAGSLTPVTKELRLASDGNFQKGLYVIKYTVKAAGYEDTVLMKDFSLRYEKPVLDIAPSFDVFTPSLKVNDASRYLSAGMSSYSVARTWKATMPNLGVINGYDEQLDLLLNGEYYDAVYNVKMDVVITYILAGSSWVLIKDKGSVSETYTTEVPQSLEELLTEITAYKTTLDNKGCHFNTEESNRYVVAFTMYQHLKERLVSGAKVPLRKMVDQIQAALNGVDPIYEVTNEVIQPYIVKDDIESGVTNGLIEIVIGTGYNYRVSEDGRSLTPLNKNGRPSLIGSKVVALFLEGLKVPFKPRNDSTYGFFNPSTGTITITNGTFSEGAYVSINTSAVTEEQESDAGPFSVIYSYAGSVYANGNRFATMSSTISSVVRVSYNPIDVPIGLDVRMNIYFAGKCIMVFDCASDYLGEPIGFRDPLGVDHIISFRQGTVSL